MPHQDHAELLQLIDSTDESIIATTTDGMVTCWNRGAERLFGYTAEEILGKPYSSILNSKSSSFEEAVLRRICAGECVPSYETWMVSKSGSRVDVTTTASAIRNAGGDLVGVSRISHDIGELHRRRKTLEHLLWQRTEELQHADALYRSLFEAVPIGAAVFNEEGIALKVNASLLALLELDEGQVLGKSFRDIVRMRDCGLTAYTERNLHFGRQAPAEFQLSMAKGGLRYVECEFIRASANDRSYLTLVARDVTKYHEAEHSLALARDEAESRVRADQRYRQVLETLADGFMVLDGKGCILEGNHALELMLGYTLLELHKMRLADIDDLYTPEAVLEFFSRLLTTGTTLTESRYRRKNGTVFNVEILASWLPVDGGRVYAFVRDISERRKSEDEIHSLAFYDPLTKLPNRRLLLERMQQALVNSHRTNLHGALVFIDLDGFKQLNEKHGAALCDHLLIEVGKRLRACVRESDTVARVGGDEFILLLEELDREPERSAVLVEVLLKKIMEALNAPYVIAQQEYFISPSLGITLFCSQHVAADELLKRADLAMYQAKAAGRNTARYFEPEMQSAVDARSLMETELRRSLHANQFLLHFQSQIDRNDQLVGAEALVRWRHPERGLVGARDFVPFAEESGLMGMLGQRVVDLALKQLGKWQQQKSLAGMHMAINISAQQFMHVDFAQQIRAMVNAIGIDPTQVMLEVTEKIVMHDLGNSLRKMKELCEFGVGFSLDDFGTGFSSLAFLKQLPLQQLKIDQSLVRGMLEQTHDAAIVRAIIAMGHGLGLQVVAEGVETAEQWDFLLREGCDIGQGELFGKPMTVPEFQLAWSVPQCQLIH